MAGFSIDNDITPLRGNYFPRSLTMDEIGGLSNKYGGTLDAEIDRTLKLQKEMDLKRSRDLNYQMGLEALQERRGRAQRERDDEARLGALAKDLQGLVSGEGSAEERADAMLNYRIENPNKFKSAAAGQLYTAGFKRLDLEQQRKAKQEAKERQEADRLAKLYGSNVGALEKKFQEEGGYSQVEKDIIAGQRAQIEVAQQQAQVAAQKEQDEGYKKSTDDLRKIITGLENIPSDQVIGGATEGRFLKPKSRREIELRLMIMAEESLPDEAQARAKQDAIMKMDDSELIGFAREQYLARERALRGRTSSQQSSLLLDTD